MKVLVIINGVTGAIGTARLARFTREHDVTVYGLSRKGNHFSAFLNNGKLPDSTLICSVGDITQKQNFLAFCDAIDFTQYKKVIYVHSVGVYPFEINSEGAVEVSHDDDGDGIDDRVVDLSYTAFFCAVESLHLHTGDSPTTQLHALTFGGIADKYHPVVHRSWWTVMGRVVKRMQEHFAQASNIHFALLNISSVICPHEIVTRPFVFQNTNANPRFWLAPHEVAEEVAVITLSHTDKLFVTQELFHNADYYHAGYFNDDLFTKRKASELGV